MGFFEHVTSISKIIIFFMKFTMLMGSGLIFKKINRAYENLNRIKLILSSLVLLFFIGISSTLHAEGTKTWQPDPTSRSNLYITSPKSNSSGVRSFGGYLSQPNMKMYVHIENPDNELVYLGFSLGNNRGLASGYSFKIISPTGALVHGPHKVNTPNIQNYDMAVAGPSALVGGAGYSTNDAMFVFDPQGLTAGDYSIEFAESVSMYWFDITVATKGASPQEIPGRLWSQAWQVDCGSFTSALKAMFYARDEKGYVTQVNFAEAGIKPYVGQFSFNDTGTGSSGNVAEDRKSVPNAQSGNPVQKVFLNQPDPNVYPLGADGEIQNLPLKVEDPTNPNIKIEVTQPGRVEIVLDFGTIGNYQEAVDKRLFANLTAGINTVAWDGLRGDGQKVQPQDYPIPVTISYTQGETHFTAYDVEYLDESFVVRTQTTAGLTTPNVLFWDDSRIGQSPGLPPNKKVDTDVGSIARQPWSNFDYGNVNTINTWWFAFRDYESATILMPGDYGDAPKSYGGAVHKIPEIPLVYLGAIAPDKESQLPATLDGTGDDADGTDDEDALSNLPKLHTESKNYSLTIPCIGIDSTVAAWVDFDQSGAFEDDERQSALCDASGSVALTWTSLSGLSTGTTYIRLRIASDAGQVAKAVGGASDGEAEDYEITIEPPEYDYGDAPDDGKDFKYGIAKHLLPPDPVLFMGAKKPVKDEASDHDNWKNEWKTNGKHKGWFNNNKDRRKKGNGHRKKKDKVDPAPDDIVGDGAEEDGLVTSALSWNNGTTCTGILPDGTNGSIIMSNTSYCITVKASNSSTTAAQLVGWIDFNQNGEFDDPSERSVVNVDADTSNDATQGNVPVGTNNQPIVIYWENQTKVSGELNTFIRLRLTSDPEFKSNNSPNPIGVAINGEVEDTNIGINVTGTDFGDAPDTYGDASHVIELDAYMGTTIDNDITSQNTANGGTDGVGDDNDGYNDDDGVASFPTLNKHYSTYSLDVTVTSPTATKANLVGWIDFDGNGVFDADEAATVIVPKDTTEASVTLTWVNIPMDTQAGETYLRLRLTSDTTVATGTANTSIATGLANDGEVEDYKMTIGEGHDFGDAPNDLSHIDVSLSTAYPTLLVNNSARHIIDRTTFLGTLVDEEDNGQPDLNAQGDNSNAINDEDGVSFPTSGSLKVLRVGEANTISIIASNTGILNAWIDWNQDGDWDDVGEQIATDKALVQGNNSLSITPLTTYTQGKTYARFRFSTVAGLTPAGEAADGEVEDYAVNLVLAAPANVCSPSLLNNGFENPILTTSNTIIPENTVEGWSTEAVNPASGANYTQRNSIEIWQSGFQGVPAYQGNQFAELNAYVAGALYQDIELPAGTTLGWSFAHRARSGNNTIKVLMGAPDALISQGQYTSDTSAWKVYSGTYTVPAGQTVTRFAFQAVDGGSLGNFIDAIQLPGGCDFGDAPNSYQTKLSSNGAYHVSNSLLYLGTQMGDSEKAAFGGDNIDNSKAANDDDAEGNAPDDEDGISNFDEIDDLDTEYSVSVTVTNKTGASAHLVGWIDFDLNGIFDDDEAATIIIPNNSNGIKKLNWNNIPTDIKSGDSFVRLRLTTDTNIATGNATTSKTGGMAKDGEIEDYPLFIKVGGFPVKGRVYKDSNINGINDTDEKGVASLSLVLQDVINNTCVSTKTNGKGYYTFFPVIPGDYKIYEASREKVTVPNHCDVTKAKDPAGYRSTTANVLAQFSVIDAEIIGKDFGDVESPTLSPNHSGTVLAGNVVFYTHTFTPKSTGTVNFSATSNAPATSGWGSVIFQDTNCNGKLDSAEASAPIASNITTTANNKICLINKVYAPNNVGAGESFSNIINADFNFNNAIAGSTRLKVTDLTKATIKATVKAVAPPKVGSGKLELRKTVQNMTQAGSQETETQNQANPGDVLKYRIYYSNTGTGSITDLKVNDVVPQFTLMDVGSMSCDTTPTGLNCSPNAVNDPDLNWVFTGTLKGGAKGLVSYQVEIE